MLLLALFASPSTIDYAHQGDSDPVASNVAIEPLQADGLVDSILVVDLQASHDFHRGRPPQLDAVSVSALRIAWSDRPRREVHPFDDRPRPLRFAGAGYLEVARFRHERFLGIGAARQMLDPLRLALRGSVDLGSEVQLVGELALTVSLLQRSQIDAGIGQDVTAPFLPCASGSELGLDLGALLLSSLELRFTARVTGDPVHLTDGAGGAGNGPIWLGATAIGAHATWWLSDGIGVRGDVGMTWATSYVDVGFDSGRNPEAEDGHHHDDVLEVSAVSVMAAVGVEVRI